MKKATIKHSMKTDIPVRKHSNNTNYQLQGNQYTKSPLIAFQFFNYCIKFTYITGEYDIVPRRKLFTG